MTAESAEIIRTFTGLEPDFTPNSTDSNIPLSLGVPANTIGTVQGALAHTRQEWIALDSLPVGLKIVLSLMLGYEAPAAEGASGAAGPGSGGPTGAA